MRLQAEISAAELKILVQWHRWIEEERHLRREGVSLYPQILSRAELIRSGW